MKIDRPTPILLLLTIIALLAAILVGPVRLSPSDTASAVIGSGTDLSRTIIWEIRIPRTLAAWLVGIALGLAGAALQGLFRNPLAEPGVLGVSGLASLGAMLAIASGAASLPYMVPLAALAGALTATALLAIVAGTVPSVVTLLLVGLGLTAFSGAAMAFLLSVAPNALTLADMVNWSLGSVTYRSMPDVIAAAPLVAAGCTLLLWRRHGLALLTLGEEAAASLGASMSALRLRIVLGTGLLAGTAVALAGAVGFVGIVAPHLVRPWVAHHPGRLLVPSALMGGLILVLTDLFIRLVPTQTELRLGTMAALIGAPVFVAIAVRRGVGHA